MRREKVAIETAFGEVAKFRQRELPVRAVFGDTSGR